MNRFECGEGLLTTGVFKVIDPGDLVARALSLYGVWLAATMLDMGAWPFALNNVKIIMK